MEQTITPNLWFDFGQAEEAANYYIDVFGDGRIVHVANYTEDSPGETGTVMVVEWEVRGQRSVGINGGPEFKFSEAVSFQINCDDQSEIDHFWDRLTADG